MVPSASFPVALVLDGISLLTSGANEKEIEQNEVQRSTLFEQEKKNGVEDYRCLRKLVLVYL
jgi:predicted peroxiredoxin